MPASGMREWPLAVAEGSALAGGFSLSIASREGAPLRYHKSDGWNYLLEAARL